MKKITATASTATRNRAKPDMAPVCTWVNICTTPSGRAATMPAKMIRTRRCRRRGW